jgi:hypothetical protein
MLARNGIWEKMGFLNMQVNLRGEAGEELDEEHRVRNKKVTRWLGRKLLELKPSYI